MLVRGLLGTVHGQKFKRHLKRSTQIKSNLSFHKEREKEDDPLESHPSEDQKSTYGFCESQPSEEPESNSKTLVKNATIRKKTVLMNHSPQRNRDSLSKSHQIETTLTLRWVNLSYLCLS